MPPKSNQEKKRHYFELFRKVYPLPDGEVRHRDKPDISAQDQEIRIKKIDTEEIKSNIYEKIIVYKPRF
jgi:hypothetical protein